MMFQPKYSIILANVGMCADRYMSGGYSSPYSIDEMFARVASVDGVSGVELVSDWNITAKNVEQIRKNLDEYNLKLVSVIPDHFGEMKWGKGAFTSKDSSIRKQAVEDTRELMDITAELGGNLISLWPGQDGYDYYFQGDYIREHEWFAQGVAECCDYRKDVNISIEYKIKEPRNFSYPSTMAVILLMLGKLGRENSGVTIDYGHAHVAGENVAESVALAKEYGNKLLHVHMNDNYGFWDDDMIAGSIHTIPFIEFFYWLKKTGYSGYISTDQYPYREDGRDAVNETVRWMDIFARLVNRIDDKKMEEIYETGNACEVSAMLRNLMFGEQFCRKGGAE
ncbi:sugar phosphate isomerase/epimerase family protein [Christensenella hongkongensis]|uniref:sugar phosphate isomerase/epimerase family protein n=2 Tax=Christensenella hongkongensis TaxID=270498 RepID=UPI0018D27360|nr:sugar phosphate isomerase/epimerase family protein [Christensenella hongkongensis]